MDTNDFIYIASQECKFISNSANKSTKCSSHDIYPYPVSFALVSTFTAKNSTETDVLLQLKMCDNWQDCVF